MAGQIPEPFDPSPDVPYRPPSKGREPLGPPGRDEGASSMAQMGRPLPIAYGTVKLPVLVIEKLIPLQQDPPAWTASTLYTKGFIVQNGGNCYEATGLGTSAGSGGPAGTGTNIADGTEFWNFRQQLPMPTYEQRFIGALCEGEVQAAVSIWIDKENFAAANGTTFVRAMELKKGPDAGGQTLTSGMGWDSSGYQHTALIEPTSGMVGVPTGTQKELINLAVELQAVMFGAVTADVSPADIINDLLTHARRGCVWPGSRVDTSITGTAAGGYRVYCDAAGFRFSMVLGEQRKATEWIAAILIATNSEAVWSGGKLKVVPLGDQNIATPVYGATGYVSANAVQYALGPNDFQRASWTRRKDPDCFNTWPIEYTNRANGYTTLIEQSPDALDIEKRSVLNPGSGPAVAQTVALPVIFPTGVPVTMLSGILTQRSLGNRNTYRIEGVPWRYILTEPTDVITLTDPVSGLSLVPMRIVEWEEGPDGETMSFIAEDYGTAVQAAAAYTPQAGDGYKANEAGTVASAPALTGLVTTADRNVQVGPYVLSSGWRRLLQALDGDAVNQGGVGVTWYRGSIDPTDSMQGAPIIFEAVNGDRLTIVHVTPAGLVAFRLPAGTDAGFFMWVSITLQPKTNADNLDSLRYIEIQVYDAAGAALPQKINLPVPDRAYRVPATPTNAANAVVIYQGYLIIPGAVLMTFVGAPNAFNGYLRCTLFNAYGPSAQRYFGPVNANPATLAGGVAPPGAPPPGGSGGSGGSSYCPAPETLIRLASGLLVPAAKLVDGAEVLGFHQQDFSKPVVGKVRYASLRVAESRYAVALTDGRVLRFSKDHRLCSVARGWTPIQHLHAGEQLVADTEREAIVAHVADEGPGPVVDFAVEGPHTYFTDDVLSHNAKPSLP